eukprot:COSAG02_NODE_59882_length_273_cov_0.580460_1_plen_56_part_01
MRFLVLVVGRPVLYSPHLWILVSARVRRLPVALYISSPLLDAAFCGRTVGTAIDLA